MSKLQTIRKNSKMSQSQLANKSGVNIRIIQKYETGERDINKGQALAIHKLAQALEVEVKDLLELEGANEQK